MAASRASIQGSASALLKAASCTASSTPNALGRGLGALGPRTPSTGLKGTSDCWAAQRKKLRQPDRMSAMPRGLRPRSEEHTSELQSQSNLVCRLLLEKKKNSPSAHTSDVPTHRS